MQQVTDSSSEDIKECFYCNTKIDTSIQGSYEKVIERDPEDGSYDGTYYICEGCGGAK